jgi:hypothetical protein
MIPETIKRHKPSGTEIRHKNGHYYVYSVKGYYDKKARKPKSRSLGCVGQIYPDIGFLPNKNKAGPVELVTKEYGATRIAMAASVDIFEKLKECFPADFIRIYVMAVVKLIGNLCIKDISISYEKSAISVMLPKVHLSKNTVSSFLGNLSLQRGGMVKFMREYARCGEGGIIFDGTSFVSGARLNPFCEKGYSAGNIGKSQIRLIYAWSTENRLPIYFMVAPGSIPDKSAFEAALDEINGKGCTIILDKGFFSAKNIELMTGMDFIIPLQKNTALVSDEIKEFSAYQRALRNRFAYHKRIIYFAEVKQQRFKGCRLYVYYDNERRQYLMENYFKKIQDKEGTVAEELMDQAVAETADYGVSMLLTTLEVPAKQVYLDYKARWAIEEMFDAHKNTLGFDMRYEASYAVQQGWAFVEFLALLIYHKINSMLVATDMIKTYNVKDLLFRASTITQSKTSGVWKVCNLSKPLIDIFKNLGVTIGTLP